MSSAAWSRFPRQLGERRIRQPFMRLWPGPARSSPLRGRLEGMAINRSGAAATSKKYEQLLERSEKQLAPFPRMAAQLVKLVNFTGQALHGAQTAWAGLVNVSAAS